MHSIDVSSIPDIHEKNHSPLKTFNVDETTQSMLFQHKPSVVMDTLNNLGWVKYFSPATKGQFYFMPRGTIVFNIMADFLKNWVKQELNALEIRTPMIYDFNDESIQAESAQFADRVFQTEINDKMGVLKPGGDYGVMSLLSRQKLLHENHLPIALFELVSSFRKNQSRELAGLLRAHTFTLLDSHFYVANQTEAWNQYTAIILAQAKLADYFNFKWELSLDIQTEFHDINIDALNKLRENIRNGISIKKLDVLSNYWTMQHYFVDTRNQIGFSDGQFDLVNAKNYYITYLSKDGKNHIHPVICHASFGSVERWIYTLVNNAIASKGHDFPLWLTPAHVRIVNPNINLGSLIIDAQRRGIIIETDARNKKPAVKIQCAQAEWVPYTVIINDSIDNITVIDLKGNHLTTSMNNLLDDIVSRLNKVPCAHSTNLSHILNVPVLR